MHIFLSSPNKMNRRACEYVLKTQDLNFNLFSYYFANCLPDMMEAFCKASKEVLFDSGAHSFQKGAKVEWQEYTEKYAQFIKEHDAPNVIGFFEMDIDIVKGYPYVLELRKILEAVSDKIIPVWHKERGIDDFKKMCDQYRGKVIAVSGFKNQDIRDEDYIKFVNYAHAHNCRIHGLGMTRKKILDKVPFDYVDSSSWAQKYIYGKVYGEDQHKRFTRECYSKDDRQWHVHALSYINGMKDQFHYLNKPAFPERAMRDIIKS